MPHTTTTAPVASSWLGWIYDARLGSHPIPDATASDDRPQPSRRLFVAGRVRRGAVVILSL